MNERISNKNKKYNNKSMLIMNASKQVEHNRNIITIALQNNNTHTAKDGLALSCQK